MTNDKISVKKMYGFAEIATVVVLVVEGVVVVLVVVVVAVLLFQYTAKTR